MVKLTEKQLDVINRISECKKYLEDTDLYVIRKLERGIDTPPNISKKRLECIEFIQENTDLNYIGDNK